MGIFYLPLPRGVGASAKDSGLSESVEHINVCSLEMENIVIKSIL